jgi:hypothetical protein
LWLRCSSDHDIENDQEVRMPLSDVLDEDVQLTPGEPTYRRYRREGIPKREFIDGWNEEVQARLNSDSSIPAVLYPADVLALSDETIGWYAKCRALEDFLSKREGQVFALDLATELLSGFASAGLSLDRLVALTRAAVLAEDEEAPLEIYDLCEMAHRGVLGSPSLMLMLTLKDHSCFDVEEGFRERVLRDLAAVAEGPEGVILKPKAAR